MSRGGRGCPSIKCVWKRSWCIGKSHRPSKGISGGMVGAGWKQLWPIGLSTVLCWSLLLLMALIHLWWYLSHLSAFEPLLSLRGSAIFNSPARTAPLSHPFTPVRWTQGSSATLLVSEDWAAEVTAHLLTLLLPDPVSFDRESCHLLVYLLSGFM